MRKSSKIVYDLYVCGLRRRPHEVQLPRVHHPNGPHHTHPRLHAGDRERPNRSRRSLPAAPRQCPPAARPRTPTSPARPRNAGRRRRATRQRSERERRTRTGLRPRGDRPLPPGHGGRGLPPPACGWGHGDVELNKNEKVYCVSSPASAPRHVGAHLAHG